MFRSIRAYAPTLFDTEIDIDYHNCIDDYENDERYSQLLKCIDAYSGVNK